MIHPLQWSTADLHLLSILPKVFHWFHHWKKSTKVAHSGLDYENVFFLMEHLGSTFKDHLLSCTVPSTGIILYQVMILKNVFSFCLLLSWIISQHPVMQCEQWSLVQYLTMWYRFSNRACSREEINFSKLRHHYWHSKIKWLPSLL